MASLNLQRNSEVFFSTVNLASGAPATNMTPGNTWKLEVLAGYALTSSAATQDITSMESGTNPDRSQQRFNTAINPVDWNFQTYIRPTGATANGVSGGVATANTAISGRVKPVADWFMWQSLVSNTPASSGNAALTVEQSVWSAGGRLLSNTTTATTGVSASRSNFSTATQNFLYFVLDNVVYQVSDATVNQATVDAGIDSIATTTWTGQGTTLLELQDTNRTNALLVFGTATGSDANSNPRSLVATSSYHPYNQMNVANVISTHAYIKNRLTTLNVSHKATAAAAANTYNFPVTAITFDYTNNITYLTPEELAVLNAPIGQFTGTRAVTGSATMYLRNGDNESAQFLRNISGDTRTTSAGTTTANLIIGGTTPPYISFYLPAVHFEFPQLAMDDVIAMSVNFVGQEPIETKGDGGEVTITAVKG